MLCLKAFVSFYIDHNKPDFLFAANANMYLDNDS